MADELDIADMQSQRLLDAAIDNAKKKANVQIESNGICIVCDGIVKPVIVSNRSIVGQF